MWWSKTEKGGQQRRCTIYRTEAQKEINDYRATILFTHIISSEVVLVLQIYYKFAVGSFIRIQHDKNRNCLSWVPRRVCVCGRKSDPQCMMKKALGSSLIRSSCWPSRSAKLTVPQRCVKTMAYAKGDEGPIFSHEAIPTPRRNSMPILGTTLDIIAAGSAKKWETTIELTFNIPLSIHSLSQ